ncbi:MAG: hypothetical protein FWB76_05945, partial [Oscillospiraceae bacterium]|nr:hypothetical protein [Oscillospiraceae bacterium]
MLLITALLIPAAARFGPYSFRFSLGQAGVGPLIPLEPGVVATGGFDVVHATTHIFHAGAGVPGITIANTGTRQLDIYREGWYAFVIRGGDGGPGNRTANNVRSAMGGAGGMVMGYVWLAAGTRVYVHLAAAGHRTTSAQTNRPATGGGLGSAHGGEGGGATVLSTGSAPTHANAIAIAGGGGGGGGINQVGTTDHANNRGGDAGGTGFTGGATHQYNPILNGAVMRGESTTNIPGVGVVSGGFRGGNPENTNITKNTARPGNTGSDGGGGGGGHNAGGQHGATANAAASIGAPLLGGNGTAWGGGGGSGWYGG